MESAAADLICSRETSGNVRRLVDLLAATT